MKTMDDETFVLKNYRLIPSIEFKFIGRFFHCLRIKMLTKSILFSKSWIDSSAKSELPPDFHNDKHHIMMEVMRIDDCVNEINGKRVVNSFERTKRGIKKYLGMNKKDLPDVSLYYLPDTRNSKEYNFKGYFKNFERVVNKHSEKVDSYRNNYPKCKKTIFLICDESNNYIQVSNKADLKREDEKHPLIKDFRVHICFIDSKFVDIIRNCNADYVIWMGYYKAMLVNGKRYKYPQVVIYDVKHMREKGIEYNHELMFKVKEEVR